MSNQDLAAIFYEIADLLDILSVQWKPAAYRKAARTLETLPKPIDELYRSGGLPALLELPGIGQALAGKIKEYLNTGTIKELGELEKKIPKGVDVLLHIPGVGPKKAWKLYKTLHIKNVRDLQRAAETHTIQTLEGFGPKSEEDILKGLTLREQSNARKHLITGLDVARAIQRKLEALPYVSRAEVAGSVRRRKETIADIDILVTSTKPQAVMNFFTSLPDVTRVLAKGPTKSAVILSGGLQADVRVLEPKQFGAALQYFTGSKDHNVAVRQIAIDRGYKLSEYGLFTRAGTYVAGKTEAEIYRKLGLTYPEPELRENTGELQTKKLPSLIQYDDVCGDCHLHTVWSDGANTTEEMVNAAIHFGHSYIAITDHSQSSYIANGLNEKKLLQHLAEIDKLQKKYPEITILKGSEVDIKKDGTLDYKPAVLKKLDIVVASAHQRFKADKAAATKRYVTALGSGQITCLGHPTGRLINEREPFDFDFEKVVTAASDAGVALEINASPSRLDLRDVLIKSAKDMGAMFMINTDSHRVDHFRFMELGIAQARRGWLEAKHVLNTLSTKKFLKAIER